MMAIIDVNNFFGIVPRQKMDYSLATLQKWMASHA